MQAVLPYIRLMRLDKPIGSLLLLWPTLWALWLANDGAPNLYILLIFVLGVIVMRSAGCVINDFADRRVDGQVKRTANRPLVTQQITSKQALSLFAGLILLSFILVLNLNSYTIILSFVALGLAALYPFMKRYTHLPQLFLGLAFSWAIPMAYAAQLEALPAEAWLLLLANLLWTVAYDTKYAMVDRDDDLKVGVKSTAILFGRFDKLIIGFLQILCLCCLLGVGYLNQLGLSFHLAVIAAGGLFVYQQQLIRFRDREACFKAFLNNNYVGLVIFLGIALHYL